MELTEEHIARSLVNVSEERRAEVLETFRELERRNGVLKQDIDSFRTDLASMGVVGVLARFVETPHKHMTLNPALWSTLPLEILQLVFAHLPLIDIIRLRALSTTWDRSVAGDIPGFTKVCAEVNPKLFGMVGEEPEDHPAVDHIEGMAAVVVHDTKTWHRFSHVSRIDAFIDTMRAGDGGLVCIASLGRDTQQHPRIVVFNPLTGKKRELPKLPHNLRSVQPFMIQVVMDRDSNCYKVIVVCPKKRRVGGVAASVYCSVTGQWESAMPSEDLVFGYQYKWDQEISPDDDTWYISSRLPCAYDCANGKLLDLDDRTSPWRGADPIQYALVKDRLFVLHKEAYSKTSPAEYPADRYCVCEYQAQRSRPHWIKVGVHRCREFEYVPNKADYEMHLYACKGFLLVTANNGEGRGFQHDLAWVYDLCAGKWQEISGLTERETEREDLAMFELQWDAIP